MKQIRIPAVFMRGGTSKATFAQVLVKAGRVDYSGNCGNMSSAIGPLRGAFLRTQRRLFEDNVLVRSSRVLARQASREE